MYADSYLKTYLEQADRELLWASEYGIDQRADTLLHRLREVEQMGLKSSSFHVEEIGEKLKALRALKPDSCEAAEVNRLQGCLEQLLTEAYMRYAYGQRYGYIRPHRLFNNLLVDTPEPGSQDTTKRYRRIFDIHCEQPSDSLLKCCLKALKSTETLDRFLNEIQPTAPLYAMLCQDYQKAKQQNDGERMRLGIINLERSRWRYHRPDERKYIWVNLADFMLTAVDADSSKVLTMKVCGGDQKHKTPLLGSSIRRLELNPYWVVPTSIIRNEYIPYHLNDSSYYARNHIVAINNQTKEECDAWRLSADQLKSGRYTLRQEKGEGNSLGRMIFRFPNEFAVYLHDTNNPSAFNRTVRAVSHGCIRVSKPLELALFLMDDPDDLTIDKLRIAIGKSPQSEKGRKYLEDNPDTEGMKVYTYKNAIPVYLDYYTLWPEPLGGEITAHADHYGYDKEIERILNQF